MRIICVDDEELVLQLTVSMCRNLSEDYEVEGFSRAKDALAAMDEESTDIALLDIDMPDMNGITMALRIKEKHPDTAIIFLTGFSQYAVDAFAMHASGYLLKPVSRERLSAEIEFALLNRENSASIASPTHIFIKTFGNFDVFVDGQTISFSRSKAKELLAYLVDRQGGTVSRSEAFALLWEEGMYDRSMQKQLDVIIRSMRATLQQYNISEILEIQSGSMRICPERVDCDMYRFLNGDAKAVNAYRGEYMSTYSWASLTEAYVTRSLED